MRGAADKGTTRPPDAADDADDGDVAARATDDSVHAWGCLRHRARRSGAADFTAPAATRLLLVLMVTAMLCGPAALLLRAATPAATAPAATPTDPGTAQAGDQIRAGHAAAELVRVWLSAGAGDSSAVEDALGRDPGPLTLPAKPATPPAWIEVADVRETAVGEWAVTVTTGGTGHASPAAAYTVLVAVDAQQAAALTLPARVPTPTVTSRRSGLAGLSTVDPVTVTVTGFLTSMLTGAGDLSRWLAPDSPIAAVGRACRTVSVPRVETTPGVGDPTASTITVLATATCQPGTGPDRTTLQYPLTLHRRDDRWEVVDYATALPDESAPARTPTPTSTSPSPAR